MVLNMSDKIKKELGRRIRDIRKIKRITQEKLAEKADVSLSYIAMLEGGKRNPTLDFIVKIAKGLNIEIYQLLVSSDLELMSDRAILKKIKEMIAILEERELYG